MAKVSEYRHPEDAVRQQQRGSDTDVYRAQNSRTDDTGMNDKLPEPDTAAHHHGNRQPGTRGKKSQNNSSAPAADTFDGFPCHAIEQCLRFDDSQHEPDGERPGVPVTIMNVTEAPDQQNERTGKPHERGQEQLHPDTRSGDEIRDTEEW